MNGLRAAFDFFDTDKNGHINMEELANALRLAGHNPTMSEVKAIFKKAEGEQDIELGKGYMDFTEFAKLADYLGLVSDDSKALQKKMSKAFKKFDKDNDGTISIDEIKEVFRTRPGHPEAPPQFFIGMLEEMDINKDGVVDYREFLSHHLEDAAEVAELVAMGHKTDDE